MWKKPDSKDHPEPEPAAARPTTFSAPSTPSAPRKGDPATIGPSISIKGDVTGEEDLIIDGRIEGKVDLKQHSVTVGRNGRVRADIFGRTLTVEGEVVGNLHSTEHVVVRTSGRVRGDISTPRVTLEDGAQFKGRIDMETEPAAARGPSSPAAKAGPHRPKSGPPERKEAQQHAKHAKPAGSSG